MAKKRGKAKAAAPSTRATVTEPDPWPGWPIEWGTAWGTTPALTERIAVVYACVERVASALSAMPLQVSKDSMPQPEPVWIRNPEPLIYTHIGDAITEVVWSLLLRGNAYIQATAKGADGYPLRWAVLDPDKVVWEPGTGVGSWTVDGRRVAYDALLHIRHLNRPGQRLGWAPLDAAAVNLQAVADFERVASKLARNSGLPTQGMLHTEQDLTETTAQRYKDKWQARGDGEVAVLGSGLRYESLALNPRDLALLELREFDGRQIATVFGVPPFMINLAMAGDLTYSTTQGMMDFFWRQTLRPMASNIGRSLGTLLPGRSTVVFNADEYTRGTYSEHVQTMVTAAGGPIIDANEARATIGLSPRSIPQPVAAPPVTVDEVAQ